MSANQRELTVRSAGVGAKRARPVRPRHGAGARVLPGVVVGVALVAFGAGAWVFGSLAAGGSGHAAHTSEAAASTVLGPLTLWRQSPGADNTSCLP